MPSYKMSSGDASMAGKLVWSYGVVSYGIKLKEIASEYRYFINKVLL